MRIYFFLKMCILYAGTTLVGCNVVLGDNSIVDRLLAIAMMFAVTFLFWMHCEKISKNTDENFKGDIDL